ncbi:PAS domain S-box-containing protein [Methylobacterium pseudosasicola]|uniref:histidine kinase n=2 Tax=Methylobacterium pseudosasicola TaxID=582667 RepID=A0A1I4V1N2_9HYPH|nr:PAS domain S-box-containing protein [Methylobacterium pseudosasicola]
MIFVTNADGRATFVSREWIECTGQSLEDAVGFGWTKVVHPDDRETARMIVANAIQTQSPFSLRYRLLSREGQYMWVAAGAIPSFGPPDQTFLGFLGSITRIPEDEVMDLPADGSVGQFVLARGRPTPGSPLELTADLLLMVHSLVATAGVARLRPIIEEALHVVGVELAQAEQSGHDPTQLH